MLIRLILIICTLFIAGCQPKATQVIELTKEPSYHANLSAQGDLALLSTFEQGVQVWDLSSHALKYTWHHGEDQNTVIDTRFSPNKKYAVTLSKTSVALWQLDDGSSIGWWSLSAPGQTVAVADNGSLLVGLTNGSVMSLDARNNKLIQFLGHTEKVNSVALSADGKKALSGGNDMQAILWHAQTGQPIHTWQFQSRVTKVALNQSGSLGFAGDSTNDARIWNNITGQELSKINIKRRQMNFSAARFVNEDKHLLTGTPAREVILWQRDTGKKIANWQVQLMKNTQNRGVVVYSVATGQAGQIMSLSSNGLVEAWPQTK